MRVVRNECSVSFCCSLRWENPGYDDELMLNVLRCHETY